MNEGKIDWRERLREARKRVDDLSQSESRLREAWKQYAIALRDQNERLENYADGVKMGRKEIKDDADFEGCYDFDAESLELEIENGRDEIEGLRHGVVIAEVIAGDAE